MNPTTRMWRAMSAQRGELSLAAIAGVLASVSAVALLGTSAWLISRAAEAPPVLTLTVAAVMVRAFALGRAIARYGERLIGHDAAFRGLASLRVAVYARLEALAPVGLARFARGDLLSRLVGDVDAALDLPLRIVLPWVQAGIVAAATVAFCAWLVPTAGLAIGLLAVVALTLSPWLVARLATRAEQRLAPTRARMTSAVVAAIDGSPELLANGRTDTALRSVEQVDDELTALAKRSAAALGFGGGVTTALQAAAVIAALMLAIPRVTDGTLAPVWLAVIALIPLALFEVTGVLPGAALALERVRGSAQRLAAVEDQPDPVTAPARPAELPEGFRGLELADVSASWIGGGSTAIRNISFTIEPRQRLWIVGPSGAGKSTLAAVLLGFLSYEGRVRINGVEAREADGDALRTRIGLLAQRSHVFDTTIGQNIALGRMDPDDAAVRAAVSVAQLSATVDALPAGLDTMVGAFGAAVSGGEAQRIALARLLVQPRPLLVLDEPSEHLDAVTAAALDDALDAATRDCATVVITHRVARIAPSDRVLVMRDGEIQAQGAASELAQTNAWFADRLRDERAEADMAALISGLPTGQAVPSGGVFEP